MISFDEARHTLELDDILVIQPVHPWWRSDSWPEGKQLPEDFQYASDTNPQRLSKEEIRQMVSELTVAPPAGAVELEE